MYKIISTERMLGLVLDALPVRVFWKDTESRLLGCNQAFATDAGVAHPSELVGRTHFEFYPPDQAEAYRADDIEVMTSGRAKVAIEEQLLLQSGQTAWVETNKLPLRDIGGAVVGVLATYKDITPRHNAAEDALRLIDDLTIARDVALSDAAAKSRFVENMSKEMRAPLEVILVGSEQILLAPGEAHAREAVAIMDAARHLLDLVSDTLEVSRFAAGQRDVAHERGQAAVAG